MKRRILAIMRKETLHIRRDPRSLYMAIGLPIVLLLLFGYAITFDIRHVAVAVADLDGSSASRELVDRIRASEYFDLRSESRDDARIGRLLEEGTVKIALIIPPDFGRRSARGEIPAVQVLVDGSNNNTALVAMGYISRVIQTHASAALLASLNASILPRAGLAGVPSVDARIRIWYNPELRSTNYIIPGLIAVVMMVMTTMLTSLTVAREWENGTMEQLIVGPVRPLEIILGKTAPYFILGAAQIVLIVIAGKLLFRVPIRGDLACLAVVSAAFLACALGIGLFVSISAKSQQLAYMLSILITLLPSYLLSGFIFPIASMPKAIQAVTYLVPARYFLATLRGIFLKGYGFGLLWPEILSLTGFALLMFAVCVRRLRPRLD
jgi:ABC-2 type transport system permease protein